MSGQSAYEFINAIYLPKPETPQWLVWLIVVAAFALIVGLEVLRKYIAYTIIRDAICCTFNGKSLEGVNIAFKGMMPEELCLPLRRAIRKRVPAGQKPCNMQVSVALCGLFSFLMGVADMEVRCGFTVDGVPMQESVRLLVHYHQARGIITPLCVSHVEEFSPPPTDELD